MPLLRKKNVSVSFAGNDSVITHIIPESDKKTNYSSRPTRKSLQKSELESEGDDNTDDEEDEAFRKSTALANDDDVLGSEVFGFKTTKKSGQMAMKASSSLKAVTPKSAKGKTPRTPKSSSRVGSQTPKSILKKRSNLLQETGQTPVGKRSQRRLHKLSAQTPHRLRSRNKQDASSESEDSASSVSDWEDDNSSTYSGPTENVPPGTPKSAAKEELLVNQESAKKTATPSAKRGRRSKKDLSAGVEAEAVESYFEAQAHAAVTSDHTLARLETPRMDQEQLNEALQGVELGYAKEREALLIEYRCCFNKWMLLMCNNYNILLHGLGSKRMLMEDFRTRMLADFSHVVVHGFFPSLTIKQILNAVTEDILEHKGHFRSPIDQCEYIANHYNTSEYEDFYLVIHNIDGPMLRAEKNQNVLSLLAQVRGIHIIASIDHINAPLIWDQAKASRFSWLWYDVTSYASYSEETSYENSLLVQQSGVLALSSLTHVMRSLTPNAQAIFLLLAKFQLQNKDNNYQGLAFPDLYQKCREAFLVNSDLTLRSQLTEFKDHKLIRSKKGIDGLEYLVVPLEESTLKEFLTQHEEEDT